MIETIEDSPIIHWGRRLYPKWMGDEINAPFYFRSLKDQVVNAGFQLAEAKRYSVLFWMWEILPDQVPILEKLTPLFVALEQILARTLERFSAHCYLVAVKH